MFKGKTLFLQYLLIRLLQQEQIVLLLSPEGDRLYLFYHNKVTTAVLDAQQKLELPTPKSSSSNVFIWSLFDMLELKEPLRYLVRPPCLPIQTALDPLEYRRLDEKFSPLFTGLPFWTRDEPAQAYVFLNSCF